jgi:putative phosphoribosyl transferase
MVFRDRFEAGRLLAAVLAEFSRRPDALVLALPRGGVPVGFEVARHLYLPLDIFLVRKLGVPAQPELALGAIASGGLRVLNEDVIEEFALSQDLIDAVAEREQAELDRRQRQYQQNRLTPDPSGHVVILVDDGLATGSSMRAAARALRLKKPSQIVAAIPVAAPEICASLASEVDRIVCLEQPERLQAVGQWYARFEQITDAEVTRLLDKAAENFGA